MWSRSFVCLATIWFISLSTTESSSIVVGAMKSRGAEEIFSFYNHIVDEEDQDIYYHNDLRNLESAGSDTQECLSENGTVVTIAAESHAPVDTAFYFLFLSLTLGLVTLQLHPLLLKGVPYSCKAFVMGVLLGVLYKAAESLGPFDESFKLWSKVDPQVLKSILLPALTFSTALTLDTHMLKQQIWQVLALAVGGVTVVSVVMGMASYWLLPFDWDIYTCALFGTALAATDTIVIASVLLNVALPNKVGVLMHGESQIGVQLSLVLFEIALSLRTTGGPTEAVEVITKVARLTLLGVLVGFVMGTVALVLLRRTSDATSRRCVTIQFTLTFVLAFASYVVAEDVLDSNGLLATLTASVMLADRGWHLFANPKTMRNVWSFVSYACSSVVLILAGFIVTDLLYVSLTAGTIEVASFVWIVVMYLILVITRALFVMCIYPLLKRSGYGLAAKEATVVAWGGIRGVITLTLAIVVDRQFLVLAKTSTTDDDVSHARLLADVTLVREAEQITFLLMGIVFITMLVNGTTLNALAHAIGLMNRTPVETALLSYVHRRFHRAAHQALETSLAEPHYPQASTPVIVSHVTSLRPNVGVGGLPRSKGWAAVDKVVMMTSVMRGMRSENLTRGSQGSDAVLQTRRMLDKRRRRQAHPAIELLLQSSSRQLRTLVDQQFSQVSSPPGSFRNSKTKTNTNTIIDATTTPFSSQQQQQQQQDHHVMVTVNPVDESGEGGRTRRSSTSNSMHSRVIELAVQKAMEHDNAMLVAQLRELFLKSVRAAYWQDIERGVIPKGSFTARHLLSAVEFALDHADNGLFEFEHLHLEPLGGDGESGRSHHGMLATVVRWLPTAMSRGLGLDKRADERHRKNVGHSCYVASCFVDAHELAGSMLKSYIGDNPESDVDADIAFRAGFGRTGSAVAPVHDGVSCEDSTCSECTSEGVGAGASELDDDHILHTLPQLAQVLKESRVQVEKAQAYLSAVDDRFPSMVVATENRKVISLILHHQRGFVNGLHKKGLLDYGEMHKLIVRIREDTTRMARLGLPGRLSDINEIIVEVFNEEPVEGGDGRCSARGIGRNSIEEEEEEEQQQQQQQQQHNEEDDKFEEGEDDEHVDLTGERLDGVGRLSAYVDVDVASIDDNQNEDTSGELFAGAGGQVRSESRGRSFALDEDMLVLLTRPPNAEDASKLSVQGFVDSDGDE